MFFLTNTVCTCLAKANVVKDQHEQVESQFWKTVHESFFFKLVAIVLIGTSYQEIKRTIKKLLSNQPWIKLEGIGLLADRHAQGRVFHSVTG